jgi:hypothetical protein
VVARPAHGIPRRLKLAFAELVGAGIAYTGWSHYNSGDRYGILAVTLGIEVLLRPAARRLPRAGAIADWLLKITGRHET